MSDTSNVQNNYLQDFWNSVLSFSSLSKNESTGKYNGLGNLAGITSATLGFISASSSKEAIKSYYGPNSNKTLNNLIDDVKGAQISNRGDYKYRQFSAKLWEAAGKANHPIHLQIQQAIGELDAKYNFNNKVLDSANNAKMLGTLGGLLTLGDLTLAVASDDANAAAKSATSAAIGLAVGYWIIPAGLPILATIGLGIAVGYGISQMWDDYNIGGRLGLIGESLSEYAFRTIEIIHEKYNQLADATEELVDELLDDIFGAIDNLLDAFAEQVDEILDSIKDELLDEILDTVKDFFDGIQDIGFGLYGFGLYLWDGFAGSNHLDDYLGFNRTGEFHVVNPDPITLDLDGDGIETVKIDGLNSILFDHDADGIRTATGWVKADDGLLVLDSNGDGKIDTGRELFGDNRLLKDGSLAPTGFAALAEHDDNGDGKIDAQDAVFEQLKVWRDLNQDGVSQAEELFTLEQLGIQSLDLNHQAVNQRQSNGNTVARLGSYTTTDGSTHKMGDLLFDNNAMISRFSDEVELSAAQKDNVNLRGMGRLRDLQQAAAKSSALADVIQDYSAAQTKQEQLALRDKLILEWANTDINPMYAFHLDRVSIQTASSGAGLTPGQLKNVFLGPELAKINGEFHQLKDKIRILDSFTGQRSSLIAYTNLEDAKRILNVIKDSYDKLAEQLYAGLLFQTRLKPYTDHISLSFKDDKLALDFSQTAAVFNQIHTKDPQKAFVDLGEFLYYSDAMKKTDTFAKLSSLFMEYAQSSISSGNFETDLAILGKEKFIALGHHLGTEQDETLKGTDLANLISGGAGNDKLYGNGGDDRLIGGEGNDRLEGGKGNDVYVFSKGHGQDSLYDPYNDSGDRIVFTDLNYADMTFRQDGSHLILASGENDYVKIDYFFSSQQYKIEHFEFADKTISLDEMMENGLILHGTEQNETIQHWQGKMIAYAGTGNDSLIGADKDDELYGEEGNDRLVGNGGDDRLIGGEGNDRLEGGKGNDVYVFSKGHGQDSLYDPYNDSGDRIVFTDLNYADMTFRQDGSHLILASGENDYVKIDYFFSSQQYKIEHFEFADKTISLDEMMENGLILHGTEQNETIQHWQGKMIAYAGAGNDSLIGADKDDELHGEAGNDKLYGNAGDDRLIGGEGNDRLEGGKGNDVYVFSKGHGQDSLYDPYNDSGDRIVFTDLNYADMTFRQDGSHLILASGENDYVKIDYFFSSQQYKIEHFEFADKTISLDEMMKNGLILHGTEQNETIQHWQGKMIAYAGAGNDSLIGADKDDELHGEAGNDKLYGNAGDDRLIGGEGNDRLEGGKGNDVYVFSKGHGQDSLYDPYNDSGDRIIFTDLNYADMTFRQDGSHLILASGENDYVKIDYFFSSQQYKIEHFEFADKTISLDEMMENGLILHGTEQNETIQHWQGKMIAYAGAGNDGLIGADKDDELHGEAGNDKLYGNAGDDRLIGGEGNDRLEGGKGNDVYVFSKGHGQDSLYDPYNDSGDRIVFTDLNYADMTFRQDGSHLILASGENDYVKIDYFFSSQQYKIEHFEFADKTISLDEMMENGLILHGTEQNETIQHWQGKMIAYAGTGNDSLIGADKDDELYGEEGNDRLVGNGGDDRLIGGEGNDRLEGGKGNDVYVFSKGHGQDSLYDPYNDSGDRIVFTDLNYADMTFRQDGSHLILASGENDYVKIDYFFSSQQYKIEHFEFADKTISLDEMMENGLILHGTEQNETIQHWQGKMIAYAGAGNDGLIGADKDDELYGEEGNDRLVGNGGNDRLYGGEGEDYLYAGAGNDMLSGGQGADRLHGGAGADVFIFDSLDAVDTLEDFNAKEDSIALDKSLFTALGENIEAAEFAFGSQAENAEQRLVFDSKTGALLYDADGSGEAAAVHIATIRGSALNALALV